MPNLESDIVGQVARLPLRPSEASALLPLQEAVMNSLHAIQDRFGDKGIAEGGRLDIRVMREEDGSKLSPIIGFEVTDNGVGLNDDNYQSFRTPFSMLKVKRGGRALGGLAGSRCSRTSESIRATGPQRALQRGISASSCVSASRS